MSNRCFFLTSMIFSSVMCVDCIRVVLNRGKHRRVILKRLEGINILQNNLPCDVLCHGIYRHQYIDTQKAVMTDENTVSSLALLSIRSLEIHISYFSYSGTVALSINRPLIIFMGNLQLYEILWAFFFD